jgi:NhaA family Na+:H+ antiporter
VQDFIHTEEISGIILFVAALVAIVWSNSPWAESYFHFWETVLTIGVGPFSVSEDLQHWVNDGLMAIFFFVVGMEVKRELVHGELSDPRRAVLPVAAALGGMVVPALLFLSFNIGGDGARGWGIPMATDIAFALGVLALLGRQIPSVVRIFLLTLATVDDIGAILVIAIFYTENLSFIALEVSLLLLGIIFALQRSEVRSALVYVLIAVLFWVGVLKSGIHATIAGVFLGFLVPAHPNFSRSTFVESADRLLSRCKETIIQGDRDHSEVLLGQLEELVRGTEAPLERLERQFHPWVSYIVLPLFALANSGITLSSDVIRTAVSSPVTLGVMVGLLVGKLIGVVGASWLAVRLRIATPLPQMTWSYLIGIGLLAGIGFTVSLFITGLAFEEAELVANAKIGIFAASIIAGLGGYIYLRKVVANQSLPS